MKGLLHSKRFKQNLKKWVIMYVGVMCLLTSVITYSRYISKFDKSDTAKTANFKLDLICKKKSGETFVSCGKGTDTGAYSPEQSLEYYFSVDPTKVDVKSILKLLIFVDNRFIIEDISEVGGKQLGYTNGTSKTGRPIATVSEMNITDVDINTVYKVVIKYNQEKYGELTEMINKQELVDVGYSLEQISINN